MPQSSGLVRRSTHIEPQHDCPAGHPIGHPEIGRHVPALQAVPGGHTRPHAPQFALSLPRFVHVVALLQQPKPVGHEQTGTHVPELHVDPDGQA
jgi:hypothetical protein